MTKNYAEAIKRIDDKLRFSIYHSADGGVDRIVWDDYAYKLLYGEDQPHPDMESIEASYLEVKADEDAVAYKNKRGDEYASVGDQLDMKYHDLLDGTTTWKDHVEGIKNKYPKP